MSDEIAIRAAVLRLLREAFPEAQICVFIHEQKGEPSSEGLVTIQHTVWTNVQVHELLFALNAGAMNQFLQDGPNETFSLRKEGMN